MLEGTYGFRKEVGPTPFPQLSVMGDQLWDTQGEQRVKDKEKAKERAHSG
jgi:hypothetical protein